MQQKGGEMLIADDFRSADSVGVYDSKDNILYDHSVSDFTGALAGKLNGFNIDAVISCIMKPMALKSLEDKNIVCYQSCGNDLFMNIDMFLSNRLMRARDAVKKQSACSPSGCSSCLSNCGGGDGNGAK